MNKSVLRYSFNSLTELGTKQSRNENKSLFLMSIGSMETVKYVQRKSNKNPIKIKDVEI